MFKCHFKKQYCIILGSYLKIDFKKPFGPKHSFFVGDDGLTLKIKHIKMTSTCTKCILVALTFNVLLWGGCIYRPLFSVQVIDYWGKDVNFGFEIVYNKENVQNHLGSQKISVFQRKLCLNSVYEKFYE